MTQWARTATMRAFKFFPAIENKRFIPTHSSIFMQFQAERANPKSAFHRRRRMLILLHMTWLKCNYADASTPLPAGCRKEYFVASRTVSTPREDESRHSAPRRLMLTAANDSYKPRHDNQKISVPNLFNHSCTGICVHLRARPLEVVPADPNLSHSEALRRSPYAHPARCLFGNGKMRRARQNASRPRISDPLCNLSEQTETGPWKKYW